MTLDQGTLLMANGKVLSIFQTNSILDCNFCFSLMRTGLKIARLVVESFERLVASNSIESEITSSQLWEQVNAFKTGSVAKTWRWRKCCSK